MKFRSVNSIVIPPASTGSDKINRSAVKKIAQINRGIRYIVIALVRMFIIVVIKLIDLRIDEIPARCSLNIAKSTPLLECVCIPDRGGYKVHPVPTPFSTKLEDSSKNKEGGSNQNLMLFSRGNAMSGAPMHRGINQFPNPPIIIGMTKKNIIIKACAVTITLYKWSFSEPKVIGTSLRTIIRS